MGEKGSGVFSALTYRKRWDPGKDSRPLFSKKGTRCWENFVESNEDTESRITPSEREYLKFALEAGRQRTRHRLEHWRALLKWLQTRQELHGTCFVMVGEGRLSETNFGCAFPRLVLGITRLGSLVGLCGHAVET
jgi:hypothetical protein